MMFQIIFHSIIKYLLSDVFTADPNERGFKCSCIVSLQSQNTVTGQTRGTEIIISYMKLPHEIRQL